MNIRLHLNLAIQFLFIISMSVYSHSSSAAKLKIAALSPDGSSWMIKLKEGAKEIEEKTQGRVKFKFYPGGVMGGDKTVIRKMKIGQLHGAVFSNGTLNNIYSGSQAYNLVLKFNSYDEIDYIRPYIDPLIKDGIQQNGYTVLGLSELGFAYLMSRSPIANIENLKQQKSWVPEGNYTASEAMKAFGITPIPLPLQDVLIALQTDMVDVIAGSPVGAITLQWHTKVNYVTDLPIAYVYGGLIISNKAMKKISENDQRIVKSVMDKITKELDRQTRKDNVAAVEAIKNQGVKWITPDKNTIQKMKTMIETANEGLIKQTQMDQKIIDELEKHLNNYRGK